MKAYKFVKKRFQPRCFPVNITEFVRIPTLKKICERLLLYWMSPVKDWAKVLNILKIKEQMSYAQ